MKRQLFLFHAKRGHGECISELKKGDIYQYECQVEKVFLNNYAFLKKDESRSSYAYEMIRYFHEDYYFIKKLWAKILRLDLNDDYMFIYLVDNLYFLLKYNMEFSWEKRISNLLKKFLNKDSFSISENNSISAILSVIYDLKLDISVEEIVNYHFYLHKDSNLDLSSINYFYGKSLKTSCNRTMKMSFESMCLSEIIDYLKKNPDLGYETVLISHHICDGDIPQLIEVLLDSNLASNVHNRILEIIFYSGKCSVEDVDDLLKYTNNCKSIENKILVYDIILNVKSKRLFKRLISKELEDSLYVMLVLNNYDISFYDEIHKRIHKLRIDYSDNSMWFEIEYELIRYFNRRNVDLRLLNEIRFFLKYGLCSSTRLQLVLILKKYDMLTPSDIEDLKYDANCDIRHLFERKHQK